MRQVLEAYLGETFGPSFTLLDFRRLGAGIHGAGFLIEAEREGEKKSLVLKNLIPEGLGHDYPSDRASVFLLAFNEYKNLPNHVKPVDVLSLQCDGSIRSISGGKEYFLLMEKVEGVSYFHDLDEMRDKDFLSREDKDKIRMLAGYLTKIHSTKNDSRTLYWRKIRDIIGHGECLMGVFDSYPDGVLSYSEMAEIEKKCLMWRVKLKPYYRRLCQVHGDFHPGNIWFTKKGAGAQSLNLPLQNEDDVDIELVLLDRSRGPWGEAADDVTALIINYIFSSIKYRNEIGGAYHEALRLFLDSYLDLTGDQELLSLMGPFFAFRGAVLANPRFYPELTERQRAMLLAFIHNILDRETFDHHRAHEYLLQ
jgi:hypothetical protein